MRSSVNGLLGSVRGVAAALIQEANASNRPIVSLDVPSGINATTGEGNHAIRAHETLTLALPKTGLISSSTGTLFLADLGIPIEVYRRLGIPYVPAFDHRSIVPLRLVGARPSA